MSGPFGVEILGEVELLVTAGEWKGEMRPCIVWRWSNEKDKPRVSGIRDMADDDSGFRAGRRWIRLSECVRAFRRGARRPGRSGELSPRTAAQ